MMKRKGQVFTLDFFIGLFAFIVLLVIGFTQLFSFLPNSDFKQLYGDATYLSNVLVDSGYPTYWNSTNVLLPGLADNHRLNVTKLHEFENISYTNSKLLFHITSEYVFFFKNQTDYLNLSNCTYGYPISVNITSCEPNLLSFNYKNLVKTQRLLAYDGNIVTMVIYTWKR
ncbi:hypothetical protein JXA48_02200 [Candidatus Woesearchaeota archaeon]|nr:hypothetical protein [Candidatus Woesearchaeota archaeon]